MPMMRGVEVAEEDTESMLMPMKENVESNDDMPMEQSR